MKNRKLALILGCVIVLGAGCTVKPPTIAHVHIGHALTGWTTTPDKKGLLVTAERESQAVDQSAAQAVAQGEDLAAVKSSMRDLLYALDPTGEPDTQDGLGFGLLPAVQESIHHLEFAAESPDATPNVRDSVPPIVAKSQDIVDRCRQIKVLGEAILGSDSTKESQLLSQEVANLTVKIVDGAATGDYGLMQLRGDVEAMVQREDPPYTTVAAWYLLNLVRLPDGSWTFRSLRSGGGRGGSGY